MWSKDKKSTGLHMNFQKKCSCETLHWTVSNATYWGRAWNQIFLKWRNELTSTSWTLIVMPRVEKQIQIQWFENWSGLKRWLQQQVSSGRLELPSNWRWTLFHDVQETFLSNKTILGASYRPRWGGTLRYTDPHCESFYIMEESPSHQTLVRKCGNILRRPLNTSPR